MPRRPDRPFGAEPEDLDNIDALTSYEDPHAWMLDGFLHGADSSEPDPQPVDNAVEEYRGRHRREVPKSTIRARLRKVWRRG
jgi:hypothetical protein